MIMEKEITPTSPEIFLDNVSFAYEQETVLKEITLAFEPGQFYSILGPNGCGKTTLLDILIGHLRPDSGGVFLRGKDLAAWSRKEIARTISLVSQNYNINFPFTVEEVIMMGRHPWISRFSQPDDRDINRVKTVMARTGTDLFHDRKITALSGGERQRCVFARALCQDTPILFLDEAFSNMDISHTLRLLNLVKKEVVKQNRTVISIFHDINLASIWSDHLIFMKQGRVVASGATAEVMDASIVEDVFQVKSHVAYNEYSQARQAYFKAE
jgi:iron complex transport system ATP-binding protein